MNTQSSDHLAKFEEAFKRFLDTYLVRRDLASLKKILAESHCGFGTGFDEVA